MHTASVFSTPHLFLKVMSFEQPLGAEKMSRTHILRIGGGSEEPWSAQVLLMSQSQSAVLSFGQSSPIKEEKEKYLVGYIRKSQNTFVPIDIKNWIYLSKNEGKKHNHILLETLVLTPNQLTCFLP